MSGNGSKRGWIDCENLNLGNDANNFKDGKRTIATAGKLGDFSSDY